MKFSQPVRIEIAGTSSGVPGQTVTTEAVVAATEGIGDPSEFARRVATIRAKTGVETRNFAGPDDSCETVGTRVMQAALNDAGIAPEELERLIFVSSGHGDMNFPATANLVCRGLGIRDTCDAFDVNNACMGFLSALEIATADIAVGSGPVGIVVVDLLTRSTTPTNPRPYLVFGDSAAAAVIRRSTSGGVLASYLRNDGITFGNVQLRNPAVTGVQETIQFTDYNETIQRQAIEALSKCVSVVLERAGLTLNEIDWILPHQPNGTLFHNIAKAFDFPADKLTPVAQEIGSTGAVAIPFSLDRLIRTKDVKPGDRILLAGVGAGVAYGAMVYEVPAV